MIKKISYILILLLAAMAMSSCDGKKKSSSQGTNNDDPGVSPGGKKTYRINDTGVGFSGNHPRTLNGSCVKGVIDAEDEWAQNDKFETLTFAGQDCEHGRDATHNDNADGHAGFSYVKISSQGEVLAADASQWHCVLDKVSGLMWEVKAAADEMAGNHGLHDADDTYSYYNTDTTLNGGAIGNWGRDYESCFGRDANKPLSFCNTQSFVERVNAAKLCGFSDWRLPTYLELGDIVNYDRSYPSADINYFPNTQSDSYWSSSVIADSSERARQIQFRTGVGRTSSRMEPLHVRLVRTHMTDNEEVQP